MITLPLALAAVTAGLVGGIHCVGMCGGITVLFSRSLKPNILGAGDKVIAIKSQPQASNERDNVKNDFYHQTLLHSGRLLTYMLIGSVFGGLGAAGMQFKPFLPVQKILFILGNLALILLGLRLLGISPGTSLFKSVVTSLQKLFYFLMPAIQHGQRHPFLMGMSWGCLPCGLLYGVAPFALLSGDPLSGAVLMLLFGLAALPHLLLAQTLVRSFNQGRCARYFRILGACSLILIGALGLWYFDMKNMPSFLCVTPAV